MIDPAIAEHSGRVFKTTGDGLLVEFAGPMDAVNCAVAIQREMTRRNPHVAKDARVVFRVGVNLSEVIVDGDDLYGTGMGFGQSPSPPREGAPAAGRKGGRAEERCVGGGKS